MRRFVGIFISIMAVCALAFSCSRGPKTIPQKKMKEIYKEMFLADQWLQDNPEKRSKADTMWFYKPILEKYGYTLDDYYHTVAVYLQDPKRFADLMESVSTTFSTESDRLIAEGEREARRDTETEAKSRWGGGFLNDNLNVVTKGYEMIKGEDSVWHPQPIVDDTLFSGPEMLVDELPEPAADSLEAAPSQEEALSLPANGAILIDKAKAVKGKEAPVIEALPMPIK